MLRRTTRYSIKYELKLPCKYIIQGLFEQPSPNDDGDELLSSLGNGV